MYLLSYEIGYLVFYISFCYQELCFISSVILLNIDVCVCVLINARLHINNTWHIYIPVTVVSFGQLFVSKTATAFL